MLTVPGPSNLPIISVGLKFNVPVISEEEEPDSDNEIAVPFSASNFEAANLNKFLLTEIA